MINYKIEQIPLPHRPGKPIKYPYRDMQIGDSFFTVQQVSIHYWELVTGFRFARRTVVEDGVKGTRIWRVEGPNDRDHPSCV